MIPLKKESISDYSRKLNILQKATLAEGNLFTVRRQFNFFSKNHISVNSMQKEYGQASG